MDELVVVDVFPDDCCVATSDQPLGREKVAFERYATQATSKSPSCTPAGSLRVMSPDATVVALDIATNVNAIARRQSVKMPDAFHWTVTSPPEGVNGMPVIEVSRYRTRRDVASAPLST